MHIQESGEMYLETIHVLLKKNGQVPVSHLIPVSPMTSAKTRSIPIAQNVADGESIYMTKSDFLCLRHDHTKTMPQIRRRITFNGNANISNGTGPARKCRANDAIRSTRRSICTI